MATDLTREQEQEDKRQKFTHAEIECCKQLGIFRRIPEDTEGDAVNEIKGVFMAAVPSYRVATQERSNKKWRKVIGERCMCQEDNRRLDTSRSGRKN